ncbi:hypothetical protein AB0M28_40425, partial [Streptomyces sp. NPDC051940]
MGRAGGAGRPPAAPLSGELTHTLLEAILGAQLDTDSGRRMWRLTRGNVLFLKHLADGELAAGRLRETGGVWRWAGTPELTPTLAELVGARMGALPEAERDVVDVLALGEPLDVDLLGRLTDPAAVEQTESRGLVQVEQADSRLQARLAHPLYGETRRSRIGVLRGRRLRGRIATALAGPGGADLLRRAVLTLESDLEPDAGLFTEAGIDAIRLLDLGLAERLSRASIAAADSSEARHALAYALGWQGRGAEADAELAAAANLARSDPERAVIATSRGGNAFFIMSDPAKAEADLVRARGTVTDPSGALTALHALFDAFLARPDSAEERARSVLALPEPGDRALVLASWGLAGALGPTGRLDDYGEAEGRGYAAVARAHDGRALSFGMGWVHLAGLRLAGRLDDGDALVRTLREASAGAVGSIVPMGVCLEAWADLARGRLRRAVRAFREVRSGFAQVDVGGWLFTSLLGLTPALAWAGDAAAARAALTELEAHTHPAFVLAAPDIGLARAWTAAAEGALSEAAAHAHEAARLAAERGQAAYEAYALHTVVRLGGHGVADRLVALAGRVQGPRPRRARADRGHGGGQAAEPGAQGAGVAAP